MAAAATVSKDFTKGFCITGQALSVPALLICVNAVCKADASVLFSSLLLHAFGHYVIRGKCNERTDIPFQCPLLLS